MAEDEETGGPTPIATTLASRGRLAGDAGFSSGARALLEKHAPLEEGLAALLDADELDAAYRLIARMLPPNRAILWVVLALDRCGCLNPEGEPARSALLGYVRKPEAGTRNAAENACLALESTHPLGLAGSALAMIPPEQGIPGPISGPRVFADLVGRAVWLALLSSGLEIRDRCILAKRLASFGVTLALVPGTLLPTGA